MAAHSVASLKVCVCGVPIERRCGSRGPLPDRCQQCRESGPAQEIKTCVCRLCGRSFETHHRRKFCGTVCKLASQRAKYGQAECPNCGRTFWRKKGGQVCCSRQCGMALQQTAEVSGTCDRCGKAYARRVLPRYVDAVRYCGQDCYRRAVHTHKRHMRRLRMLGTQVAGEEITLAVLYQRDKGTCHLCRQPVDLAYKGRHRLAPSIDHLIPLSKGGVHRWENVALAHFGCNCRKSATRSMETCSCSKGEQAIG